MSNDNIQHVNNQLTLHSALSPKKIPTTSEIRLACAVNIIEHTSWDTFWSLIVKIFKNNVTCCSKNADKPVCQNFCFFPQGSVAELIRLEKTFDRFTQTHSGDDLTLWLQFSTSSLMLLLPNSCFFSQLLRDNDRAAECLPRLKRIGNGLGCSFPGHYLNACNPGSYFTSVNHIFCGDPVGDDRPSHTHT